MTIPVIPAPAPSLPGVAQTSGCTTVMTVAELFTLTGSAVEELIVAVLLMGPVAVGEVTVIVMVPVALSGIVPVKEQEMAVVPVHVHPAEPVAETNVVPAGMVSAT